MNLRQVCAELRGWTFHAEGSSECNPPYYWKDPKGNWQANHNVPAPLAWDSVGELRDAAIKQDERTFTRRLREVAVSGSSRLANFVGLACATKEQILAAAVSVLRPMEVDEAVRLVEGWSP